MPLTRSNSQRSSKSRGKQHKKHGHDGSPPNAPDDTSMTNSIFSREGKRTREDTKIEGGKRYKSQLSPNASPGHASVLSRHSEQEHSHGYPSVGSIGRVTFSLPSSSSTSNEAPGSSSSSFSIISGPVGSDIQGMRSLPFSTAVFHSIPGVATPVFALATTEQQSQAFAQGSLITLSQQPTALVVSTAPVTPPSSPQRTDSGRVQCQCGKSSYYMYAPKTSVPSPPRCVSKRCPCFANGLGCVNCRCRFCENPQGINQIKKEDDISPAPLSSSSIVSFQTPSPKKIHKAHGMGGIRIHPPVQGMPAPTKLPNPLSSINPSASSETISVHPLQLPPLPQTPPNPTIGNSLYSMTTPNFTRPSPPREQENTEINWVKYRFNKTSSDAPVQKIPIKSVIQTDTL